MSTSLIVYPDESTTLLKKHLKVMSDPAIKGVGLGIAQLNGYLLDLFGGDLGVVLGRPGHLKSSIMAHVSRLAAMEVALDPNSDYAPPIYISNEMPVEDLQLRNLSNFTNIDSRDIRFGKQNNDWNYLERSADDLETYYPVVYIASSLYKRNSRRSCSIEHIEESVIEIVKRYKKRPRIICVDYLQRMTMESGNIIDRRNMTEEIVQRLKDMALYFKTPVLVGSQAKREVELEKFPIPALHHGKESGGIEEAADWVISGMRPSRYWPIGEAVPYSKKNIIVTQNLYFLKVLKQRSGDAGKGVWVSFDPRVSQLDDQSLNYQSEESDE